MTAAQKSHACRNYAVQGTDEQCAAFHAGMEAMIRRYEARGASVERVGVDEVVIHMPRPPQPLPGEVPP